MSRHVTRGRSIGYSRKKTEDTVLVTTLFCKTYIQILRHTKYTDSITSTNVRMLFVMGFTRNRNTPRGQNADSLILKQEVDAASTLMV
jgi:hypothetical protein